MILLTKLDNQKILINLETVKYLEAVPDTLIFFTNGESIMVKESLTDIANAVACFHAEIVRQAESATRGMSEV
ncbi:MAG: flagellar FlbD family protein [Oligoflexus sp.]